MKPNIQYKIILYKKVYSLISYFHFLVYNFFSYTKTIVSLPIIFTRIYNLFLRFQNVYETGIKKLYFIYDKINCLTTA